MDLTKEEIEAYNFVKKMVPKADGKINNHWYYWCGWALREAFVAGFNFHKKIFDQDNIQNQHDDMNPDKIPFDPEDNIRKKI